MDHVKPSSRTKATNIISFLPTRTSFAVRYHPKSPGAEAPAAKMKNLHGRGFSGPLVSIVPMESRRKDKGGAGAGADVDGTQEPTSPKVSCIGQIKQKKKAAGRSKNNHPTAAPYKKEATKKKPQSSSAETPEKRPGAMSALRRIFRRKARPAPAEASGVARGGDPVKLRRPAAPAMAPSLGQMKRFASGRDTLGSFDWKKVDRMREKEAAAAEDGGRHGFNWYSDEEEEDDDDVIIPHSAPIVIGGGGGGGGVVDVEPKKEVNIWKRRTFAPVTPLQLS